MNYSIIITIIDENLPPKMANDAFIKINSQSNSGCKINGKTDNSEEV